MTTHNQPFHQRPPTPAEELAKVLEALAKVLKTLGFEFNSSSAVALRGFLKKLLNLQDIPQPKPPARVLVVSFGSVQSPLPDGTFPPIPSTEYAFMAMMNKGQRLGPVTVEWFKEDGTPGTLDGDPTYVVDDPAVAEWQDMPDGKFVVGLAGGDTVARIKGDPKHGPAVGEIELSGQVIVNDPADDVTRGEIQGLDNVSDVPTP